MPNSNDIDYQVANIERKLMLLGGYGKLTEAERGIIENLLDAHSRTIPTHIPCAICGCPMTDHGKCPKRHTKEHASKRDGEDRSIPGD